MSGHPGTEDGSPMIDRVTDAIRKHFDPRLRPGDAYYDGNHDVGLFGDIARIAIEAMREPTAEMALVKTDPEEARMYWRLMIDAALKPLPR